MNATRWVTLSEFVKHLGRSGIARVDETEKGWFLAWIDSSPKALAKQEASMKKERATMSDEMRERLLIQEQIERAEAEKEAKGEEGSGVEGDDKPAIEEGLKRDEGEKLVLSFSAKPAASSSSNTLPNSTTPAATAVAPTGFKFNALKPAAANPLKRPNVFKMAAAGKADKSQEKEPEKLAGKKRDAPMTAAQQLILEDQERKRRKMERESA